MLPRYSFTHCHHRIALHQTGWAGNLSCHWHLYFSHGFPVPFPHPPQRSTPAPPPGAATLFQLCHQLLHRHQLFILAVFLHIQNRIQELRKNKRRPVKAERQGLFSGLLFCADCGGKLHFATSKRFEGKQDRYVCCHYKSNRGTCTAHYIREDVLREIVLERIRAVNEYIRDDVDAFQEEWLQCRRTDQERSIRDDKKKVEQAKKRLSDLDVIISRLYEDYVLGNLSQDRYKKMSADYEAEQERLKLEIEVIEEWVEQREEMNDGLDAFIVLTQKYVDVEELTQTIVNEYIKKIVVYAPDKSSGKRTQKVKIYFNFVDDVDIPIISEPITTETTYGPRKTGSHRSLRQNSYLSLLSLEIPVSLW